jgi:hypothetical protein
MTPNGVTGNERVNGKKRVTLQITQHEYFQSKVRYFESKFHFLKRNFVCIVLCRPNHGFQFKTVRPQYERWQMAELCAQFRVVKIYRCFGGNQLLKKITLKKSQIKLFVWKFSTLLKFLLTQLFEHLTAFFTSKSIFVCVAVGLLFRKLQ